MDRQREKTLAGALPAGEAGMGESDSRHSAGPDNTGECQPPATDPPLATVPAAAGPPAPVEAPRELAPRRRRIKLPAVLFVVTCLSTFFIGMIGFDFLTLITEPIAMVRDNWRQGLTYMLAVMGILLAHEMGHFLQAVRYGVPASLPYFIPLPITPLGTMGAVIALGGSQANRKELFDIGITGPLAGLVLALPVLLIGLLTATPFPASSDVTLGGMRFGDPLIFKLLVAWLRPDVPADARLIVFGNPLVVAGWVGIFVTGLNMLPIGQLDGGHVAYALMGKRAWWLARAMVLGAIVFMLFSSHFEWVAMLALVVYLGIRHPATANDQVELGRLRTVVGWASLAIPLFCFTPVPLVAS
ncbi:MAG TPA: site-2 protease family protein [Pirellulales bacterium]|nr:site-2 protease family protein [Pirellulales bacterium]